MKALITLFTIGQLFNINSALASISYIETSSYHCSNGKSYDLARSYNEEPTLALSTWGFSAFCPARTLSEYQYSFFFSDNDAHEDLLECMQEPSEETLACFKEYKRLNEVEGHGDLPKVVNAPKRPAKHKYEIRNAYLVNKAVE